MEDHKWSMADLDQLLGSTSCMGIMNLDKYAEYYCKFFTITQFLIRKSWLSESEQSRLFQWGFQLSLWAKIEWQLEVKIPNHYPGDPYDFEKIKEAATHVLRGTKMESEESWWKETVIDNIAPPAPAPVIKGEDLASFLNKFAQTLVTAITTKSHNCANHKHEAGEKCCHFCGELGHFVSDCLKVVKYIEEGKICKNQEGHIVLSSGAYIPRNISMLEIFLSPLGHAYSLDICTVIDAYTADWDAYIS